ncbi:hypothetical protein [Paractinoplanes durhamensis]|uniref:Adhesin domain-containing protein n=1 Tax=Paractinoplanes durhamensis TaxID=113563 RepID=A0ABQ3ZDF1_9ACTN|nr:hypothetical protein [Actinoplanes durhamensis]GIE07815.1 hypothetical protein Adu01nite_91650 [Actinoplanes durhamensis]
MDGSASSDLDTSVPQTDTDTDTDAAESWPRISDYWPDAPHRMGPAADWYPDGDETAGAASPPYTQEPDLPQLISPPPRPRRGGLRFFLAALAAVVFLGGSVLVLARMVLRNDASPEAAVTAQPTAALPADPQNPPVSVQPAPDPSAVTSAPSAAASTSAPAAALPFTSGTFELTGNVVELNVTIAALGTDAVQVSTPDGSGLDPKVAIDGDTLKVNANPDGSKGNGRLDVKLNGKVTWALRMSGGMTTGNFALGNAKLRRIDLNGGANRFQMSLPTPDETLPIRMTGGVGTWEITTADKVPLSVLLRQGAGEVQLNGNRVRNIKRNTNVRADGGAGVESGGLGIDAVAGLGTLTVAPD